MQPTSRSIVLSDAASCDDLQGRLEAVLRTFKTELDLFFLHEAKIDRDPGVVVHVWWEPENPDLDVRLVCDKVLGASYINVTGPDAAQQKRVLDALAARFDAVPPAELRKRAREDTGDSAWVLLALGMREDFDQATYELIGEGLQSPQPARRRAAAHAATVLAWPRLAGPVRAALSREKDAAARDALEIAVETFGEP